MTYRQSNNDTTLVVGCGRSVVALDRDTGKPIWRVDSICSIGAAVMVVRVVDEVVVVLGGSRIVVLDRGAGAEQWRIDLSHAATSLLVNVDRWFVGGAGEVSCVTPQGALLWTNSMSGLGVLGPAMAIGDVAVSFGQGDSG